MTPGMKELWVWEPWYLFYMQCKVERFQSSLGFPSVCVGVCSFASDDGGFG